MPIRLNASRWRPKRDARLRCIQRGWGGVELRTSDAARRRARDAIAMPPRNAISGASARLKRRVAQRSAKTTPEIQRRARGLSSMIARRQGQPEPPTSLQRSFATAKAGPYAGFKGGLRRHTRSLAGRDAIVMRNRKTLGGSLDARARKDKLPFFVGRGRGSNILAPYPKQWAEQRMKERPYRLRMPFAQRLKSAKKTQATGNWAPNVDRTFLARRAAQLKKNP